MHDHDDHDHVHDQQHPALQQDHDAGPMGAYEVLEEAVRSLLIEKGILTAQEIAAAVDLMDSRTPALGAKVVARAWVDAAFKKRLLKDTRAALSACDIDIGTIAEFSTVENTPSVHNVVVCTLRYLVLPMRPKATRGWSEDQLATIVTRDCMIGTALPIVAAAG